MLKPALFCALLLARLLVACGGESFAIPATTPAETPAVSPGPSGNPIPTALPTPRMGSNWAISWRGRI